MDEITFAKKKAADKACEFVENGMVVGLGTGSTAEFAIKRLGERVNEGLDIRGVPSSEGIARLAEASRVPLVPYEDFIKGGVDIDIDIDGADRVDPDFNLIKGGGGAHVREKQVATASREFFCVVDETKLVDELAGSFPLPVEVKPDSLGQTKQELARYGDVKLRMRERSIFISDNSNYILDVSLRVGEPLQGLEVDLNRIPGVVDNGLFTVRKPDVVVVAYFDGRVEVLKR